MLDFKSVLETVVLVGSVFDFYFVMQYLVSLVVVHIILELHKLLLYRNKYGQSSINTFAAKHLKKTITSVPRMFQGFMNIDGIWVQHRVSPEPFNLSL